MKKFLLIFSIIIFGCSFPVGLTFGTPTPIPTPTETPSPTQTPLIPPEYGSEQNPLILALAPSPRPSEETIKIGEIIAAFIQAQTGYHIVTVIPTSEQMLVESFNKGNAHIGSLSPYGYVLARETNSVTAIFAKVREGKTFYGAQIIANRDHDFTSYFDEARGENIIDPATAFKQFNDKKACWSDEVSPSGYVVPLGLLNQAQVKIRGEAFLDGQPSVVRAVYVDDICDFGATFVDARTSPTLEADYSDVMDKVVVIWRIPEIIPYENISISTALPIEMRRVIQRAFVDLMLTPDGKTALQTMYGIDQMQIVEDAAYAEFITYVNASGLDLLDLIK